ncbi:NAD-dependent epimerase/dehydratase family protein [Alcanivorax sediminis]|uniref:NAD-dependent epimerase/dehydratase family protein n=1 Tax=Alcanivorax sediminis TaxID=2663008 RepID=A0A6N7LTP2_9GAMM|nr:NAD-dependent epimerase/dehydratase family protein [Alcanivorax sediminis]MQX53652.1 NAD-dependent epimerase/dehydratase family protein [Alcanivorax sediminis]
MPVAFISGARGFLGGHIVDQLLEKGWDVTAVIRPRSDASTLQAKGVSVVQAPLDNATELALVMPPAPDAVFHVAGNTSMWRRGNAQQYKDNVLGTRAMVSAAQKNVAGRFIHTSSISAWGIQDEPINELTPSNAANDWINYNRTKYLAEQEVENGIRQGLDAVILNPCGIIGAGDTHNWSQMIKLINDGKLPGVPPGGGNFCAVEEVAKAHITAYEKGISGERYILAGIEASFLELVQTIARQLGRKVPTRTVPPFVLRLAGQISPIGSLFSGNEPRLTPEKVALITHRVHADSSKAVEQLGFNNQIPLATMIENCITWMAEENLL